MQLSEVRTRCYGFHPNVTANSLVEGVAVEDGVLNVHPDEVGLGRGHDLVSSVCHYPKLETG
jgi:hypothetical protein